jgi:L-fucose isomerase
MATISLLTFSDGRGSVATDIDEFCRRQEGTLRAELEATGHVLVTGTQPITSNQIAVAEARKAAAAGPDLTVLHYPVWAFPHFTMLAATASTARLLDVDVDDLESTR